MWGGREFVALAAQLEHERKRSVPPLEQAHASSQV